MKLFLSLACLLIVVSAGSAAAAALPDAPHLVVNGHAETEVRPDLFEVAISVVKPGVSVAEITGAVESTTRRIVDELLASGLAETDVKAANLQVQAQYEYDDQTRKRVFVGNEARRDVTARFASLQALHQFLDRVPTGEIVQIGGITTRLSDEAKIKTRLLDEAVADSKRAAEQLAARYGQRIVGVHSISDQPLGLQAYSLDRIQVSGTRVSTALAEGVVKVAKDVYVVFLIGKD